MGFLLQKPQSLIYSQYLVAGTVDGLVRLNKHRVALAEVLQLGGVLELHGRDPLGLEPVAALAQLSNAQPDQLSLPWRNSRVLDNLNVPPVLSSAVDSALHLLQIAIVMEQ